AWGLGRRSVCVLTPNPLTAQWLEGRGISPAAIVLTKNGSSLRFPASTDAEVFEAEPSLRGVDGRRFVLFFARLTGLKGARDLGLIGRQVIAAKPDTPLIVCGGDGPEAGDVRSALGELEK